ncbi:MAG: hypothetical protein M1821_002238 [Bathelium mastoideum]|nr:MAG: hypothetical protein M1821_002238 [Bathelium mastoideum]
MSSSSGGTVGCTGFRPTTGGAQRRARMTRPWAAVGGTEAREQREDRERTEAAGGGGSGAGAGRAGSGVEDGEGAVNMRYRCRPNSSSRPDGAESPVV